jgi:hypothetical protein
MAALFWPLASSNGHVALCTPFGVIDYDGKSIVSADSDRIRARIEEGSGGCVVNGSLAECRLRNVTTVRLIEALIRSDSDVDGVKACRAVHEMANVLGLVVDESKFEYWKTIQKKVKERYYEAFEKSGEELRMDEIAAVTLPLLLPSAAIALRVLFGRKRREM